MKFNYLAIDAVVNIWTLEAISHRPDWTDEFPSGKVKSSLDSRGVSLEAMIAQMDSAGIGHGFLIAAKTGRPGLPGSYHMPLEVVSDAVAQYPDRFSGLIGLDPYQGMDGVRMLEEAVVNMGFIGAHIYPHWYELAPNEAKWYPYYTKCIELEIPVQIQVGLSLIYSSDQRCRSVSRPICLDEIGCDLPELKLIGTHVGIPWTEEMIAMSWKHENIHICTDAHSPVYWPESLVRYIQSHGRNKVIFGTDFPVLQFKRTVDEIDNLGLEPDVRRQFMRDNAMRLYGLIE